MEDRTTLPADVPGSKKLFLAEVKAAKGVNGSPGPPMRLCRQSTQGTRFTEPPSGGPKRCFYLGGYCASCTPLPTSLTGCPCTSPASPYLRRRKMVLSQKEK